MSNLSNVAAVRDGVLADVASRADEVDLTPLTPLTPEEVDKFARHVVATLADKMEIYKALCEHAACAGPIDKPHACIYDDLVLTNQENVRVYFAAIKTERMPDSRQLAALVEAARRRVHQGVPFEDFVRAYRIGVGAMLDCLLTSRLEVDVRVAAKLTVQYVDCVTTAAERAYVTERRQLVSSDDEASRVFLARLVTGEFTDPSELAREADSLGLDVAGTHIAINVAPRPTGGEQRSATDRNLASIAERMSRALPDIRWALLPSGLYVIVSVASASGVESVVGSVLRHGGTSEATVSVGIGSAHTGAAGLMKSVEEAERARTLGCILEPHGATYRYEDLRYCDIFRSGEPLQRFVGTVLGPLVAHDRAKHGNLAATLYEFFSSGMSRKQTARRLRIHPNTLDYRLRKAEAILGETALTSALAFRYQLAFRLLPVTHGDGIDV